MSRRRGWRYSQFVANKIRTHTILDQITVDLRWKIADRILQKLQNSQTDWTCKSLRTSQHRDLFFGISHNDEVYVILYRFQVPVRNSHDACTRVIETTGSLVHCWLMRSQRHHRH